jgi:hypothetical protein
MLIMFSTADFQPPKNRLMIWLMYSCWCIQCTQCTHQKIAQFTQCTQCTQCVHTCQMFTTSGRVQLYIIRQYRMSVRCMAATDIRISSSSSGFSTRIFLRTQICRVLKNFFDFSKVPDRFSTSWNCELHSRRQPYTIMATWPSKYEYHGNISRY